MCNILSTSLDIILQAHKKQKLDAREKTSYIIGIMSGYKLTKARSLKLPRAVDL